MWLSSTLLVSYVVMICRQCMLL